MYTQNSELGTSTVPAFLSKLWTLVDDPSTNDLICWDPSGKSFHVLDQTRFAKEMLPLYFKHNNIASFIRQLNMYGFRKVITVEIANVKIEKDDVEFAHPCFLQGQENLLEFIKRKVTNSKVADGGGVGHGHGQEDFSRVYADVSTLKGRQDSMTTKLEHLKIENEVLWKELVALRQRHMKQEQIVNKLIQFLVTLVGDRTIGGMKRKLPLMLQDTSPSNSPPPAKIARDSHTERSSLISAIKKSSSNDNMEPLAILKDGEAPTLELTDFLEDNPMGELFSSGDPVVSEDDNLTSSEGLISSALSLEAVDNEISPLVNLSANMSVPITTVAKAETSLCNSDVDTSEMVTHLDSLQNGLDEIHDRLAAGQFSFDASTLFDLSSPDLSFASHPFNMLFNPDSNLLTSPKALFSPDIAYLSTPNMMFEDEEESELAALQKSKPKNNDLSGPVIGNALVQYNPSDYFNCEPSAFADQDILENLFEITPDDLDHQ